MDVEIIFKIAAIGIMVSVVNQLLIKSGREGEALMLTVAGLIITMLLVLDKIKILFDTLRSVLGL